jgi:dTDP-4-amino-4,6-dideoxy-D-galactose acyltransferase
VLEWDSGFFGRRIAQLDVLPTAAALAEAMDWCRAHAIDCVYCRAVSADPDSAWALENAGFVARDVRLDFARPVPLTTAPATAVRRFQPGDVARLEAIASEAFTVTRFMMDPNFPRDAVGRLYATWVANSCRGYAADVLVFDQGRGPAGFVTLQLEQDGAGRIGLIGVAPDARGMGAGRQLIAGALTWFAANARSEARVSTQGTNVGAQRLYQHSGFVTRSASTWYHRWFDWTDNGDQTP